MVENKYPYNPGRGGINFDLLFKQAETEGNSGKFKAASGRDLSYTIKPYNIEVQDPPYILDAFVFSGIASFNLRTKILPIHDQEYNGVTRHPDMFAGKFVRLALDFFNSQDQQVGACESRWLPDSDNFAMFVDEFAKTGDLVKSAHVTWSGQNFALNGYSQLLEDNIWVANGLNYGMYGPEDTSKLLLSKYNDLFISALFTKPTK